MNAAAHVPPAVILAGAGVGAFAGGFTAAGLGQPPALGLGLGSALGYFGSLAMLLVSSPRDRDGVHRYETETELVKIQVEESREGWRNGYYLLMTPSVRERLPELARQLSLGASFSMASFGGRGKLFSRAEFEILRDEMIKLGLAHWRNPHAHGQGVDVSRAGRAFFRHYANGGKGLLPPSGRALGASPAPARLPAGGWPTAAD